MSLVVILQKSYFSLLVVPIVTFRADVMFINITKSKSRYYNGPVQKGPTISIIKKASRYYNGPVLQMPITLNTYYYNNLLIQSAKE